MEISLEDIVGMDEASNLICYGQQGAGKTMYATRLAHTRYMYGHHLHNVYSRLLREANEPISFKKIFYKYHSIPLLLSIFSQAILALAFQEIFFLLPIFIVLSIPMILWDIKMMREESRRHRRLRL